MSSPKKRSAKPARAGLSAVASKSLIVLLEGAPFHVPAIRKRAKDLGLPPASAEGGPSWTIDLEVVGDAKMARLNGKFREKPVTTDVLSFPAAEIFRKHGMLGTIVVCSAQLRRQANALGHSEVDELKVLLVHGFCHLLDWDHELGAAQARAMARVERSLLEACFPQTAARIEGLVARAGSA